MPLVSMLVVSALLVLLLVLLWTLVFGSLSFEVFVCCAFMLV